MKSGTTLRLILGDQLNSQHSWFRQVRKDVLYTLMEVRQETDAVRPHIQKVAGFFSAMRHFSAELTRNGHRVAYLRLDDPCNAQSFDANLNRLIREEDVTRFEYLQPDDYRLDCQLARLAAQLSIPSAVADTEHFLTSRRDLAEHFQGKKRYLMESFYRQMRRRHDILIDDGRPAGGKWNYDQSNRQRYDGKVRLPETCLFGNDVSDIVAMLDRCQVPPWAGSTPND